jgi:hypothetical protein
MDKSQVTDLKRLEQENARLKKILAERDLEIEVMKEINAKKWWAFRSGISHSGTLAHAEFLSAAPAGCFGSRARCLATGT